AWVSRWEVIGGTMILVVGVVLLRQLIRRTKTAPLLGETATPEARWFDRLLAILAAHGFSPAPGDTPREFAATVAAALRPNVAATAIAEVPLDWAEAYYEARFGGTPLTP